MTFLKKKKSISSWSSASSKTLKIPKTVAQLYAFYPGTHSFGNTYVCVCVKHCAVYTFPVSRTLPVQLERQTQK